MIAVKFAPKNKADMRRVFNNIYIKNIPDSWTQTDLVRHFEQFGQITSSLLQESSAGKFAFICFGSNSNDREYGPKCA